MDDFNYAKLKNRDSGIIIELNSNPFTIGRGLSCNYVIPNKTISRVHCVLEKNNNSWLVRDTSTNGTFINGSLIKGTKSRPLQENDTIMLTLDTDCYIFQCAPREEISDEQLCLIADSVLNDVEIIQPNPQTHNVKEGCNSNIMYTDHVYSGPPPREVNLIELDNADSHLNKRPRTEDLACGTSNTNIVDLTENCGEASFQKTTKKLDTFSNNKSLLAPSAVIQDHNEEMENELQCAICSELFIKAVTLNCSHTFCKYCIEMWKKTKSDCPICRTKINGMTATLVLDNVIEKVIQTSSEETKQHRKQLIEDRQKLEKPIKPQSNSGTRSRRTTRRGRGRHNVNTASASVIEVSSDSSSSISESSTSSSSYNDSDTYTDDTNEWRDDFIDDIWYDGLPGVFYGGYGNCYACGRRGHWANGCPYR